MEIEKLHLFDEFVLDTARGSLLRAGQPVHLRPQAYMTLKYLAENRGRLISKDQLIEEVWEGRAVTDDSLVQCLRDVRQALGDSAGRYLRNERGRGYIFDREPVTPSDLEDNTVWSEQIDLVRMVVEDEESSEAEGTEQRAIPAAATRATLASLPHSTSRQGQFFNAIKHHKRGASVALLLTAFLAVGVVFFTRFANRGEAIRSLAVLPFANASGDPKLEYLSDGLSESLIDRLSELPGLKVIARSSSFKYKGQEIDPRDVGKALGVEALLMGRVIQRGDDLQMRVELVDARTGTQIWGEQYRRQAADVQAVQEEMARTISEKLRLRLSNEWAQQLTKRATENSQAYQFYLNGLFYFRQGGVENARRALDYYNQAVAMDPDFALAWAGLAKVHLLFAGNSWLDPKESNAMAKAAAERALKLDDTLADAHAAMARLKQHEWDWAGADREFRRAIELNPSEVSAHDQYTDYLSCMERHGEALAENKRAQELDPLQSRLRRREAWTLHLARRSREALQLMDQLMKLELPTVGAHYSLAWIYEGNGMYEEAVAEHRKAINMLGETTGGLCYLGGALAGAGRKAEAQAILDKLKTTKDYVSPEELAGLYAMLGDKERAFAQLERAYAAHDPQLQVLKIDLRLDSLRSDPRFQDLLRRVGLPS